MTKIGVNSLCPCGSLKKYKKCCMNKTQAESNLEDDNSFSPHYFSLKGKNAEVVVHELAQQTFFTDWCFLNPKLSNGKELCDLLVVFDDIAIVWQIKNLKLDEKGSYKIREKEKNLRQLSGAKRTIFDLKVPIELENARRIKESFDATQIKEVHYISVLVGEGEWSYSPVEEYNNLFINVFSDESLQILLSELNTITDFTQYLRDKKNLFENKEINLVIDGGEHELMAYYLMNDRSFEQYNTKGVWFLQSGAWEQFNKSEKYKSKKEADRISYGWDNIIDRAHEGSKKYERLARELARPDRFKRRMLADAFYGAYKASNANESEGMFYRRIVSMDDATYCFLFMDTRIDRKERVDILTAICMVARIKFDKQKVIGVATGSKIRKINAYDYCVMDIPRVTEKFKSDTENMQQELKIFINAKEVAVTEDEYPIK